MPQASPTLAEVVCGFHLMCSTAVQDGAGAGLGFSGEVEMAFLLVAIIQGRSSRDLLYLWSAILYCDLKMCWDERAHAKYSYQNKTEEKLAY